MKNNNWQVKYLKDLCKKVGEYGLNAPATPLTDKLPLYLRITDITETGYYSEKNRVSVNYTGTEKILHNNDFLFARTGATVGKTYLNNNTTDKIAFAGYLIRFVPDLTKIHPYFLALYCQTKTYWNWVKICSMRSGQPGISAEEYGKMPILCPPLDEQQKIVEVLETWDKAIGLTKRLIEQKELQKKYLMQQLLTGRTRLKGFTSKWKTEKLNELIRVYQGYPFKSETYTENGRYNVVTIANVQQGYLELNACSKIANIPSDLRSFQKLEIGDIILSMTGNVGRSCYVSIPNCLLNQRVAKIQGIHLNSQFLYYSLQNPRFIYTMIAFAQGGAQANLSVKDIKNYVLYFPIKEQEQQAIAKVLSSCDKEIDLLKQKLAKLEEQKKGLMQVLLTGKVRLV